MIKAIIVDDEQFNREQLRLKILDLFKQIEVVALCENGEEAILAVEEHKPDLVFLDIEMPRMNGFEFLKHYEHPPFEVVFITAYNQYAIKAIKFSALDYLLKPIDIDELKLTLDRFFNKYKYHTDNKSLMVNFLHNLKIEKKSDYRLALNTTEGTHFLNMDEIIRCEADSNYTRFYLNKRNNMLASKTLKEYEELLAEHNFLRIHKSHLVNKNYITSLNSDGYVVLKDQSRVEVSRRRFAEVRELLNS